MRADVTVNLDVLLPPPFTKVPRLLVQGGLPTKASQLGYGDDITHSLSPSFGY